MKSSHHQFWAILLSWISLIPANLQWCTPVEDSMTGRHWKIHFTHRRLHQTLTFRQAQYSAFVLQLAKLPYLSDMHISVADNVGLRTSKALLLNVACHPDALANRLALLPRSVDAQLFVVHSLYFDMNVNPIQHGIGDSFLIFRNGSGSTPTGLLWVIEPAVSGIYAVRYVFLARLCKEDCHDISRVFFNSINAGYS